MSYWAYLLDAHVLGALQRTWSENNPLFQPPSARGFPTVLSPSYLRKNALNQSEIVYYRESIVQCIEEDPDVEMLSL